MAIAGGVTQRAYLPAFIHQHYPKLARDGKDDCRVMMAQAYVAAATLGESQRTEMGHEKSIDALVRQAVEMRDRLDRDEQTGPLDETHTTRMIELMWPRFPLQVPDDIRFSELMERMLDAPRFASISGNASRIKDPTSPLHRTSGGHELGLARARVKAGVNEMLVYDPWRKVGKAQRGEWRPAIEIKQFAYKDSDQDLTAVFVTRYGSLTDEALTRRRLNVTHAKVEAELLARIVRLEGDLDECQGTDCTPLIKAGVNETVDSVVTHAEHLRR